MRAKSSFIAAFRLAISCIWSGKALGVLSRLKIDAGLRHDAIFEACL